MSWVRKKKKYSMPRNMYDSARIEEEGDLMNRYGLKNKKEIWKAKAEIDKLRARAKELITAEEADREELFNRLKKIGFGVNKVADILALDKEDWLKRRLQTVVYEKGLAATPKQARQFIVHGHVTVDGKVVNVPSYVVKVDEEDKIDCKIDVENASGGEEKSKKKKAEEYAEEIKEVDEEESKEKSEKQGKEEDTESESGEKEDKGKSNEEGSSEEKSSEKESKDKKQENKQESEGE
jgi:small subunit ribosomal protein S4